MASKELQDILEQFKQRQAAAQDAPAPDLATRRENSRSMAYPASPEITVSTVNVGPVPSEWVSAPGADPDRRLLYFHGGGYVVGAPETRRDLAGRISAASGCVVLTAGYRLAPEHPFPAAVDDAWDALRFIRASGPSGQSPARALFIGGESAGGGLTLATLVATRDAGEPMPDAAVTLSAWTDLAISGESMQTRATADPMITDLTGLREMIDAYLGGADPRAPLASPLYADLSGLPPLLMQVGDDEVLLSDTTAVAEKARAAGVEVTEEVWPEMFHVFQSYASVLPEAQQAVERIGEFLKAHVKTPA